MVAVGLIWLAGVGVLLLVGLGLAMSIPLMRRRMPDDLEYPHNYGMPGQEVTFASRDGLQLGGWWIPAKEARGTVVMCPGQNGSLDKDIPQARPLYAAGFNVLMFDFRGHGRSQGEMVTLGALEQADLFGALDYLQAEHGITRAGVLGLSMGAGVALMVAAQDQRIAAAVVDGAYTRLARLLKGWFRERGVPGPMAAGLAHLGLLAASLRAQYQLYRANPIDLVSRITAPVLFIHGERDPFVSGDEVMSLAAQINGPVEVWRVPEAGHREARNHHPDDYDRRVVAWFEQHLVGDAGAASA